MHLLGEDHIPEEISPYPYKFFYWIDSWACSGRWSKVGRSAGW
jgi:hypothetical protein